MITTREICDLIDLMHNNLYTIHIHTTFMGKLDDNISVLQPVR